MQAVLAQLGPEQALPILHGLATASLPHRREVLEALLTDELQASGQTLRATLQALHRKALLTSIFHPDRVRVLRQACRSLTKEAT